MTPGFGSEQVDFHRLHRFVPATWPSIARISRNHDRACQGHDDGAPTHRTRSARDEPSLPSRFDAGRHEGAMREGEGDRGDREAQAWTPKVCPDACTVALASSCVRLDVQAPDRAKLGIDAEHATEIRGPLSPRGSFATKRCRRAAKPPRSAMPSASSIRSRARNPMPTSRSPRSTSSALPRPMAGRWFGARAIDPRLPQRAARHPRAHPPPERTTRAASRILRPLALKHGQA